MGSRQSYQIKYVIQQVWRADLEHIILIEDGLYWWTSLEGWVRQLDGCTVDFSQLRGLITCLQVGKLAPKSCFDLLMLGYWRKVYFVGQGLVQWILDKLHGNIE